MISDNCKENFFNNDYDNYVKYVKQKFDGNTKRYAIQDYSNVDGKYIYNVKIFNDFLATGLTNQRYVFQEEKITVSYDENKNLVFSVGNYVDSKPLKYMASNDYLRVEVTQVTEKYSFCIYKIKFINRSNYTIVVLSFPNEIRATIDETEVILEPGENKTVNLSFEKFYDSTNEPNGIVLNAVRVMENYTGDPDMAEAEIENAVDKFSMTVAF